MSIKGSWRRARSITREEEELRMYYAFGRISLATYNRRYAELKRVGLIRRSGQVMK